MTSTPDIDRLRELGERAFAEAPAGAWDAIDKWENDTFDAKEELSDTMHEWLPALLAQLEAATARIGVLEEALEPFAKDADDWYTPGVHYDDSLELWQTGRTSVTVGHLRAARSALNSHADGTSPSKETAA